MEWSQGDIIRIQGYRNDFLVISNNSYIRATGFFHVCPLLQDVTEGPLHISIHGDQETSGTAICEQIKLIDPSARSCIRRDRISYNQIMNVSDALQGIFEYD